MTTVARIGKPEAKRDDIYEDWQAVGPTVTTVGGLASRTPHVMTVAKIGKPGAEQ